MGGPEGDGHLGKWGPKGEWGPKEDAEVGSKKGQNEEDLKEEDLKEGGLKEEAPKEEWGPGGVDPGKR